MKFLNRYYETQTVYNRGQPVEIKTFLGRKFGVEAFLAFITLSVAIAFWLFTYVPTGYRGVVTQFGKITEVQNEGLVILAPWEKLSIFSTRSEDAVIKKAEGATSDTQPVSIDMTVRYSIFPNKVAEVFEKYSHNGDLQSYVQTATAEVFKSVTARYTAPELISKRSAVSKDIKEALATKLALYGAQVINIDMTGFSFSNSYMAAINEKTTQEQLRQAADNKLKTVESEQKQKVAVAEAEASAAKVTADGEAYAQLTVAKAQAESLRIQGSAIQANAGILELRRIEVDMERAKRWDGKVPQNMYAGAPIPFLSMEKK
jgi:regulator of protease activity HflC (stomatin/prohibitin superfamily)